VPSGGLPSRPTFAAVKVLTPANYGEVIQPSTSAIQAGIRVNDEVGNRRLEILYFGTTGGGVYGVPAGSNGINSLTGSLSLCSNDLARLVVANNGAVSVNAAGAGITGLTVNTVDDSQIVANALAGGRYSTLSLNNSGTPKAQVFWDNTNNLLAINTTPALSGVRINGVNAFGVQAAQATIDSSRTSSTAFTPDAQLSVTVAQAGTYLVNFSGSISGMTAGLGGLQFALDVSSAALTYIGTQGFTATMYPNAGASLVPAVNGGTWNNGPTGGSCAFFAASASYGSVGVLSSVGVVTLSAGTNIRVNWGQAASNATPTIIKAGATLTVQRIL